MECAVCKEPQRQPRPISILVVEDDPLQQDLLNSVLTSQDYEVAVASGGVGAFWEIRENKYDLVLVDFQLPEAVLHGPEMRAQSPQPRSEVRRCGRRSGDPTPAGG